MPIDSGILTHFPSSRGGIGYVLGDTAEEAIISDSLEATDGRGGILKFPFASKIFVPAIGVTMLGLSSDTRSASSPKSVGIATLDGIVIFSANVDVTFGPLALGLLSD